MKEEWLYYVTLLLLTIDACDARMINASYIGSFVYGTNVPGEMITYYHRGEIPSLTPHYTHVIDQSKLNPELEKTFTFLKVEYISPMSRVSIQYIPETYTLKFTIFVPFIAVEYGVAAYALNKRDNSENAYIR